MDMAVGNKVKFLNEDLEGVIKQIISDQKLLITAADGFDYEVAVNEVLIVNSDNTADYQTNTEKIKMRIQQSSLKVNQADGLQTYKRTTKFQYERTLEIDLHLEKLVEFPERLPDWQRLHTQMQHAKKCLEAAMQDSGIHKIVFIHGVGTGVLKTELLNYVSTYSQLTVRDADFLTYGKGATEVIFHR